MSDQGAPVEGTTAPEAAAPSFDMSPVLDRVGELAEGLTGLSDRFGQLEQRIPQPEPEQPEDPWSALFPQDDEPEYEPEPQAPQLDPQALQAAVQQAIKQSNQPLLEKLQQFELQQATERLYGDIPSLRPLPQDHPDHAAHEQARQATHQLVVQSLRNYPPQIADQLAADPGYIATVFKAAEADKRAQGEVPAGGQIHQQEAAGGALPGGNNQPVNPVDQAYANRPRIAPGFGR